MGAAQDSKQSGSHGAEFFSPAALQLLEQLSLLLVREHLFPLKQQHDDALRGLPKNDPNPTLYISRQLEQYDRGRKDCREILSLHLYGKVEEMLSAATQQMSFWPTSFGEEHAAESSGGDAIKGKQPEIATTGSTKEGKEESLFVTQSPAYRSPMPSPGLRQTYVPPVDDAVEAGKRNTTTAPTPSVSKPKQKFPPPAMGEAPASGVYRSGTATPPGPSTGTKRPAKAMKDFFSSSRPSSAKKSKAPAGLETGSPMTVPKSFIPTKKSIALAEVHKDECVHQFKGRRGLYVLRCNLTACKKAVVSTITTNTTGHDTRDDLSKTAVYFTANPRECNRARDHFRGPGHGLKDLEEIYRKYAARVIDATEACNLGDPANRSPCLALGETRSSKATHVNAPSLLRRTFGGAAKDSESDERSGALQSSPSPPRVEKDSDTAAPDAANNDPSGAAKSESHSPTSPSEDVARRRPKRAAAVAVKTYGPFAISDDEGPGASRRLTLTTPRGAPDVDKPTHEGGISPSGSRRKGKAKSTPDPSFNPSGTVDSVDSESDETDSSIPACIRKMLDTPSRMV